jgi:hypothetical protein
VNTLKGNNAASLALIFLNKAFVGGNGINLCNTNSQQHLICAAILESVMWLGKQSINVKMNVWLEDSSFLGCYSMSTGKYLLMFQESVLDPEGQDDVLL